LRGTVGGEAGYVYIQDASSKQALGVISTLMEYVKWIKLLPKGGTSDFSISKWLERDDAGWIFITNYSEVKATLKPPLSLFIDLMGRKLLSLRDDPKRRIFFILDEFGTLQKLTTIADLLTLSRSKGGAVLIGLQDTGQLTRIYGDSGRQTLVNACGTSVHFSVADPDTAEFVSKKIGEARYKEMNETLSMGVSDFKDGISLQPSEKTQRLVMPSDLQNLPDLECYVKLPGHFITRTKLDYRKYEGQNVPFILRDGFEIKAAESVNKETGEVIEVAVVESVKMGEKAPAPSADGGEGIVPKRGWQVRK
jgi:type IV secretory pathway TraG/TraD family ATPase VirD4